MQGLLSPVVVLGYGFSFARVCGFVRTFDLMILTSAQYNSLRAATVHNK